jgi:pyrroline-5-carboxylate reductase
MATPNYKVQLRISNRKIKQKNRIMANCKVKRTYPSDKAIKQIKVEFEVVKPSKITKKNNKLK